MEDTKKVVILGAGQDASYMAEYLIENTSHQVVIGVRRTSRDNLENLSEVVQNERVKIVTVDLADAHSITALVKEERPDYLINLAGITFVPDSFNFPAHVFGVNAVSLVHILEAVREYVPNCRVFSAGSSTQEGGKSIYAVSKVAAQGICKVYRERYGMYVVHGIMHNHTSPRQNELFLPAKIAKGVVRIAKAIKEGREFEPLELGNLDSQIDISSALDFVRGIWMMMGDSTPHVTPHDYTLCSGELHSVREMVEKAFKVINGIPLSYRGNGNWHNPTNDPLKEVYELGYIGGQLNQETRSFEPVTEVPGKIRRDPTHISGLGWNRTVVRLNPAFYRPTEPMKPGDSSAIRRELGWEPSMSFDDLVKWLVESEMEKEGLAAK